MTCPACGALTVPGARFCHACGTALPDRPAGAVPERRVVTVLFGDLSDFTAWAEDLDPERVGAIMDRVLAALADAVTTVDGHVDKLTGDGIMAVFGAPVAHEDDPVRAVRAAAHMQQVVSRLVAEETGGVPRLGLRVGLNTGEVVAGVQARLSYTVVGDAVNTAARLSDVAEVGSVYAGATTRQAARGAAVWRQLPPLRLKGKRRPVDAYELVRLADPAEPGARPAPGPLVGGAPLVGPGPLVGGGPLVGEAAFVGREAELGRLRRRLREVADRRRPAVTVVTGEAGVGKTRLVEELLSAATGPPGWQVLRTRVPPYGATDDWAPLLRLVRQAMGLDPAAGGPAAADRVREAVNRLAGSRPAPPDLADRLLRLLDLPGAPPAGPRERAAPGPSTREPSDADRLSAAAAVFALLTASGPLALVVDDAQWAANALLMALSQLVHRVDGAAYLLVVGRPGPDPGLPGADLLEVSPLDDAASRALLRAHLSGGHLPAEAETRLLERAAGNPFFLAELLALLAERGALTRDGDRWSLAADALEEDLLPSGVQSLLAARFDALPGPSKVVLRAAAVAGQRVSEAALVRLAGGPVRDALRDLVGRGLLQPARRGEYAFVHALAREAAYAGIGKVERAERHAELARWAAGLDDPAAGDLVAAHAERAVALAEEMGLPGDHPVFAVRPLGVTALGSAGSAAVTGGDFRLGRQLLDRAARLAGRTGLPDGLAIERAAAIVEAGRPDQGLAEVAGLRDARDPAVRGRALLVAGQARRLAGDLLAAGQDWAAAAEAAAEATDQEAYGEALRRLGLLDYFTGRLPAAERRFAAALEVATRAGDRRGQGWALQHLAWSATTRGDFDAATAALSRGGEVFTELADSGGLAWCGGTEGLVRLLQGRLREARELTATLLPHAEAMAERWGAAALRTIDALAAAELGEPAVADDGAAAALADFAMLGDPWGQALALVARGLAARTAGPPGSGLGLLEEAVAMADRSGHPLASGLAATVLGYCQLDAGRPEAALQAADRAAGAMGGLGPIGALPAAALRSAALLAAGDAPAALALAADVVRAEAPSALLLPRRKALAGYASALLAAGRSEEAVRWARAACREPAEDLRSRVTALRILAEALVGAGRPAEAERPCREAQELVGDDRLPGEAAALQALGRRLLSGPGGPAAARRG